MTGQQRRQIGDGAPHAPIVRDSDVEVGGFRIHAVHAGAGEPVVLVHGLAGSHRWWRFTIPALAARFAVHVPELVGFGGSRPAPRQPAIAEMADLIAEWLAALGIPSAHLVGHSLGAEVGIHLAARSPERLRRLVLAAAAGVPRAISMGELLGAARHATRPRSWGERRFLPTVAADSVRAGPWTLLQVARQILADDVRPLLARVAHPTLLVWGEHDPLTPVRAGRIIEGLLPDAKLVVVPGAAHNVMADQPAAFNRLVLDFLDDAVDPTA